MRMSLQNILVGELDQAFHRKSWHGPNLIGSIRGITPEAALRTVGRRKCIWQQLMHAAYWKHRAMTYLDIAHDFPRPAENWLTPPDKLTPKAWKADQAVLRSLHEQLRAHVAKLSHDQLTPKVIWLIQGAAAHDLYHAGQIKLLRRLLADRGRK